VDPQARDRDAPREGARIPLAIPLAIHEVGIIKKERASETLSCHPNNSVAVRLGDRSTDYVFGRAREGARGRRRRRAGRGSEKSEIRDEFP